MADDYEVTRVLQSIDHLAEVIKAGLSELTSAVETLDGSLMAINDQMETIERRLAKGLGGIEQTLEDARRPDVENGG
jgi:hypothetical protein